MAKKQRRSLDQQITDLAAKIVALKQREAQKKAQADPALRHVSAALRSIDKALAATEDAQTTKALSEVRLSLAAYLGADGLLVPARSQRAAGALEGTLLTYVRSNPGQRGEQIAAELGTDTDTLRPVMKRLIADGKVATEGMKRGMRYTAV